MQTLNRLVLTALLLCGVSTAVQAKVHQFQVAPEFSYITYKEPDVSVKDKGMMYGVMGAYDFRPESKNALTSILDVYHVDMHVNFGQVDYTGSGEIENIDNYLYEGRLWAGKDIAIGETYLTPYVGFGYRYLYDDLGGKVSTTGAVGYDRRSQYFYLPFGANYRFKVTEGWVMTLNAEYDLFLKGIQDSYLSDISGFPDLQNDQDEGYGVRGSVKLTKTGEKMNLFIEPYVRYWHIEDSDIQTAVGSFFIVTGYEPENTSTEFGARVGVEF